jgi:hypothetical protein
MAMDSRRLAGAPVDQGQGREDVARLARAPEQGIRRLGDHGHRLEAQGEEPLLSGSIGARPQPAFADERAGDRHWNRGGAQRRRFGAGERLDLERERKAPGALRRLQSLPFGGLLAELRDRHAQLAPPLAVDTDPRPRAAVDELARQAQLQRQGEQVEHALGPHLDHRGRGAAPAPAEAGLPDQRRGLDLEPRALRIKRTGPFVVEPLHRGAKRRLQTRPGALPGAGV